MYRVGIIGYGVVGKGIAKLFGEDVTAIYDPETHPKLKDEKIKRTHMVVVCVPTNTAEDGESCDTSIVEETLLWLKRIKYKGIVLIKSAVVPSEIKKFTARYPKLKLVVSPEYMGESKYFTPYWKYPDPKDMKSHAWQIYGGEPEYTTYCVDIFKRKMSVDTIHVQTDIMTAALTKYMENSFFATKVTFVNEWYDIAKTYGIDFNELRECWLADTRINRNHTLVFPFDRGFGGRCFPKDTKAITKDAEKMGYSADLMKAMIKVNKKIRHGEK